MTNPNPFLHLIADEVKNISIDSIIVSDRQRKDYGDLSDLDSIKTHGLINPILVRRILSVDRTTESTNKTFTASEAYNYIPQASLPLAPAQPIYILITGGRRLAYFKTILNETTIPAGISNHDISENDLYDLEFFENKARKSLTFSEEAVAFDRIADRIKEKLGAKPSGSHSDIGTSDSDVAKMLGVSSAHLSQSRKLAKVVKTAPTLLKGVSKRSDALVLLNKVEREIKTSDAARRIEEIKVSTPLEIRRKKLVDSFIVDDTFDWITTLSPEFFDLIEFDPPWGIERDSRVKHGGHLKNVVYKDSNLQGFVDLINYFSPELYRIAKPNSWLIIWAGLFTLPSDKSPPWETYKVIYETLTQAGFKVEPLPGVWYKPGHRSIRFNAHQTLSTSKELFLYARKGEALLNKPARGDVFEYSIVEYRGKDSKRIHDAEKPVNLYNDLLATFVGQGAKICSPFIGSGNVLLSASNLGCEAVGCDKDQKYKDFYTVRVNESQPGEYTSYGD